VAAIFVPRDLADLSGTIRVDLVPSTINGAYPTGTPFPFSSGVLMPAPSITEVASWYATMPLYAKKGIVNLRWRFEISAPGAGFVVLTAALAVFEPGPPLSVAVFFMPYTFDISTLVTTTIGEVVLPCDLSLFTGNMGNAQMFAVVSRGGTDPGDTYTGSILFDNAFVDVGV
jgi:hypothetical protein